MRYPIMFDISAVEGTAFSDEHNCSPASQSIMIHRSERKECPGATALL